MYRERSPNKSLNYKGGSLREKLTLPQTIHCWLIQNPYQFYDHSDIVELLPCILYLNLKNTFSLRECSIKMRNFTIHFVSLLAVWLTIHFNKQVDCGTTVHLYKWESTLIFILHCDYLLLIFESFLDFSSLFNWESYLFYSEQYFNFQILSWQYFWFILLCLFALLLLNVISATFFFLCLLEITLTMKSLSFLSPLLLPTLTSNRKHLLNMDKMGILWGKILLYNTVIFMHDYLEASVMDTFYEPKKLQTRWNYQHLLGLWSDERTLSSVMFSK